MSAPAFSCIPHSDHPPQSLRVRLAPSPTGYLHVGTARTALFNYLYAKRYQGTFVLRIEDTDLERSEAVYTQNILDSLHALGLQWDEGPIDSHTTGGAYGPYKQSERLETYKAWAHKLLNANLAYWCYCTQAELDAEREQAMALKRPYIYSRRCLNAQTAQELKQDASRKPTLRFKIPDELTTVDFDDLIRGHLSFEAPLIGDFVILKSNGTASYNFAVVVDDILMAITDVIRGEDHIPNTPKQVLLFQAFKQTRDFTGPLPRFAHVGMILAPDRSKLSKRHGATAVSEFIYEQGYLPEAFCNFLALLGWSPPDGQEVGTLEHFASQFSIDRIAHSPAVFDHEKLNWLNSLYIRQLPLPELLERSRRFLSRFDLTQYTQEQLYVMLEAVREPLKTLAELPEAVDYFFAETIALSPDEVRPVEIASVFDAPETPSVLAAFEADFLKTADFSSPETLAEALKGFIGSQKPLKTKQVMWPIRATLTGRTHGADLSKTLWLLGKQRIQHRLNAVKGFSTL